MPKPTTESQRAKRLLLLRDQHKRWDKTARERWDKDKKAKSTCKEDTSPVPCDDKPYKREMGLVTPLADREIENIRPVERQDSTIPYDWVDSKYFQRDRRRRNLSEDWEWPSTDRDVGTSPIRYEDLGDDWQEYWARDHGGRWPDGRDIRDRYKDERGQDRVWTKELEKLRKIADAVSQDRALVEMMEDFTKRLKCAQPDCSITIRRFDPNKPEERASWEYVEFRTNRDIYEEEDYRVQVAVCIAFYVTCKPPARKGCKPPTRRSMRLWYDPRYYKPSPYNPNFRVPVTFEPIECQEGVSSASDGAARVRDYSDLRGSGERGDPTGLEVAGGEEASRVESSASQPYSARGRECAIDSSRNGESGVSWLFARVAGERIGIVPSEGGNAGAQRYSQFARAASGVVYHAWKARLLAETELRQTLEGGSYVMFG